MFRGSMVALVTPMREDGSLDEESLRQLVEWHVEQGTDGLVAVGTTGESATLDLDEHCRVIRQVVEYTAGRIPVIAGTGANSTTEAIELTQCAKEAGADACLLVTPYYNKPTQEGLYQHFKAIAEAVPLPQVLYNVPGRTSVNMLPETVARLAELDEVVAIKEASGNLGQMAEIINLAGDKITLLSGDDNVTLPVLALGGKGVISVIANIVPKESADMIKAWEEGDVTKARNLYYRLMPLSQAMFFETNPVPVKTSLALMSKISEEMRLPLTPMSSNNRERLIKVLKDYGLI